MKTELSTLAGRPLPGDANVVLIGMPGAGKSTVGVILAKQTTRDFVDTDVLIQTTEGVPLQTIVDERGYRELRRVEEDLLLALQFRNHVIATGGSAVYSERAMQHLRKNGVLVYLCVTYEELEKRVCDFMTRGIAKAPGRTFREVFDERRPLYERYADVTIDGAVGNQEDTARRICESLALDAV